MLFQVKQLMSREGVLQVKEEYIRQLEGVPLPVWESSLSRTHMSALSAAVDRFLKGSFGIEGSAELRVRPTASSFYY
jgi:hypothetical protein